MILDSDIIVDILRKLPEAVNWSFAVPTKVTVSGVAALEVLFGANSASELRRTERVIAKFEVTWPTSEDAIRARELATLSLSDGLGVLDALIAASALRLGEPLATFNIKHFRAIPGLLLVQPYERA